MANPELVEDGEEEIIDALIAEDLMKFLDFGIGTTAPQKSDTGMESACGEARTTGVMSEASASVMQVVGTHTFAGSFAITEIGLFNHVSAGQLIIRGTFAAVNVVNGESIQATVTLEIL